jgi:hypothetical protein
MINENFTSRGKGPKQGETWNIEGYKGLIFVGVGRDFIQTKYFIFSDPVDGYFIITKDEFYAENTFKERTI